MTKKKALLIIAHGSRSPGPLETFEKIIDKVREESGFAYVAGAYLEFAEPGIETAVMELCGKNITTLVIMPYFLFEGMHIKRDIPEKINRMKEKYQHVEFILADVIGFEPILTDIIMQRAEAALAEKIRSINE